MDSTISPPTKEAEIFERLQKQYADFFKNQKHEPEKGFFWIGGERFLIYRAKSASKFLRYELEKLVGSGVHQAIYHFGRAYGGADANFFINLFKLTNPMEKLIAGPIYFGLGGYAVVNLLPESHPSPNDDYLLVYTHPNSYEVDEFIEQGIKSKVPVCQLNAGYSAGWCSVAMNIHLEAKEITCRARGDKECLFVMAPSKKLNQEIKHIKEIYQI